jgi:Na+-transporting methylmalonyl-CoA/oxaloacetate decarboxylase gamma subunit
MSDLAAGFELMGYGLAGVFSALIIFYCVLRVLTVVFKEKPEKDK